MGQKPENTHHFLIPGLADAEERNRQHPETFHIPPGDERASLKKGDLVQLSVEDKERLWFEVVTVVRERDEISYQGKLRSRPVLGALRVRLRLSGTIRFEPRNILKFERAKTK